MCKDFFFFPITTKVSVRSALVSYFSFGLLNLNTAITTCHQNNCVPADNMSSCPPPRNSCVLNIYCDYVIENTKGVKLNKWNDLDQLDFLILNYCVLSIAFIQFMMLNKQQGRVTPFATDRTSELIGSADISEYLKVSDDTPQHFNSKQWIPLKWQLHDCQTLIFYQWVLVNYDHE